MEDPVASVGPQPPRERSADAASTATNGEPEGAGMREKEELDPTVAVVKKAPAPASFERTIASLAAVLPILRRLDANCRETEKGVRVKYSK